MQRHARPVDDRRGLGVRRCSGRAAGGRRAAGAPPSAPMRSVQAGPPLPGGAAQAHLAVVAPDPALPEVPAHVQRGRRPCPTPCAPARPERRGRRARALRARRRAVPSADAGSSVSGRGGPVVAARPGRGERPGGAPPARRGRSARTRRRPRAAPGRRPGLRTSEGPTPPGGGSSVECPCVSEGPTPPGGGSWWRHGRAAHVREYARPAPTSHAIPQHARTCRGTQNPVSTRPCTPPAPRAHAPACGPPRPGVHDRSTGRLRTARWRSSRPAGSRSACTPASPRC